MKIERHLWRLLGAAGIITVFFIQFYCLNYSRCTFGGSFLKAPVLHAVVAVSTVAVI